MTFHDLSLGFLQKQLQWGPFSYWLWGVKEKLRSWLQGSEKTKNVEALIRKAVPSSVDKSGAKDSRLQGE